MIHGGQLCSGCSRCECRNLPTEREPVRIRCPACNRDGCPCELCGGDGRIKVTSCPKAMVSRDVWEAVHAARAWERGHAPMPGGALDQTQVFTDAARMVLGEIEEWKSILMERSLGKTARQ